MHVSIFSVLWSEAESTQDDTRGCSKARFNAEQHRRREEEED